MNAGFHLTRAASENPNLPMPTKVFKNTTQFMVVEKRFETTKECHTGLHTLRSIEFLHDYKNSIAHTSKSYGFQPKAAVRNPLLSPQGNDKWIYLWKVKP